MAQKGDSSMKEVTQKGDNLNQETKSKGNDEDEKMQSDADERSTHPTDRGWAWMILLGSWVNMFFLGGMYKTSGILFIEFQKKYSSSSSMTSLAISLLNFGYSLSTIFTTSVLLTRISARQCVMFGSVLVCLVYIVSAFAPTIEVLVFSFGLFLGLSQALILPPTIALVGQYFDKRRGLANCIAQSGGSAGSLVYPIMLRTLLDNYSLFGTLLFVGGICLNIAVSGSLFRPPSFYSRSRERTKPSNSTEELSNKNVQRETCRNKNVQRETCTTHDSQTDDGMSETLYKTSDEFYFHTKGNGRDEPDSFRENETIKISGHIDSRGLTSQTAKETVQQNDDHNHSYTIKKTVNGYLRECDYSKSDNTAKEFINSSVQEPLLYYSPTVARAILGSKPRERHISEISNSSRLGNFIAAVSNSSLGLYASTELSVSSVLDITHQSGKPPNKLDSDSASVTVCFIMKKMCSKLSSLFDCSVLRRPPFLFFLPSACFLCSSCSMVLVYLPPHARDQGLTDLEITIIMSIIGGIDIVSLLLWGFIADCGLIKRYQLVTIAVILFGITAHLISLYVHFTSFVAFSIVTGLVGRVYFSMFPVLLVDFLGLEYLRSALGFQIMTQTTFNAVMIPLIVQLTIRDKMTTTLTLGKTVSFALTNVVIESEIVGISESLSLIRGLIRDSTGSYNLGFHVMGTMMIIGGLWLLTVPMVIKFEKKRQTKRDIDTNSEL